MLENCGIMFAKANNKLVIQPRERVTLGGRFELSPVSLANCRINVFALPSLAPVITDAEADCGAPGDNDTATLELPILAPGDYYAVGEVDINGMRVQLCANIFTF